MPLECAWIDTLETSEKVDRFQQKINSSLASEVRWLLVHGWEFSVDHLILAHKIEIEFR